MPGPVQNVFQARYHCFRPGGEHYITTYGARLFGPESGLDSPKEGASGDIIFPSPTPFQRAGDDHPEFLGKVPIFENLSPAQLQPLGEKLRTRKYQRGEVVFHQDDPGDHMHIIVQGRVRISIDSDDGLEKDVALLNPGECFGEMALLDGSNRSANATAVDDIETLILLREDFIEFLGQYPQVAAQTTALLTNRLRNANQMMGDLAFLDVPTRVAKQLLELAENQLDGEEAEGEIQIPIGQDELARLVGSIRETVSRALTSYRSMGLLTTSRRHITITDLDALERMAAY